MITAAALQKFLERPRRDLRGYKKLSRGKLNARMCKLPVRPPIWTKLKLHQRACLLIGAKLRYCAFYNQTGTGKTLIAVALARYFTQLGKSKAVLVLVPNRINKGEWAREIRKHSRSSFCLLRGSSADKWRQLEQSDALFIIETYAGMVRMVCDLVPSRRRNKRGGVKNQLTPNRQRVQALTERFQGLIADEGTVLGDRSNLPFRICRKMTERMEFFFNLTATPFGRDPVMLWSQMYLIDRGYTLGENLALFREAFYRKRKGLWTMYEWAFQRRKMPLLNRLLADCSIRFEADEADLPDEVAIRKYVGLPEDAHTYYKRAMQSMIAAHKDKNIREMKNLFLRMRQISSGFVGYYDDDLGSKAQLTFSRNPKLELLLSLIESIPREHKVIVFHDFTLSGLRISAELEKLKIGHVHLYGGTREIDAACERFNRDPDCQVCVLQNKFGIGLNLQVAKYGVYYEAPVSVINRKQTKARVVRQYSSHETVFIYDLLTRGTMDDKILAFHAQGDDLFKAIIDGRVELTAPPRAKGTLPVRFGHPRHPDIAQPQKTHQQPPQARDGPSGRARMPPATPDQYEMVFK